MGDEWLRWETCQVPRSGGDSHKLDIKAGATVGPSDGSDSIQTPVAGEVNSTAVATAVTPPGSPDSGKKKRNRKKKTAGNNNINADNNSSNSNINHESNTTNTGLPPRPFPTTLVSTDVDKPPSYLILTRTSDFGRRHQCGKCGSTLSIVYDDEGGEYTWLSAGSFDDFSLEEPSFDDSETEEEVAKSDCEKKNKKDLSLKAPEKKKEFSIQRANQYCEKRVSRIAHICCASVQPWYVIPSDVGSERIKGAG